MKQPKHIGHGGGRGSKPTYSVDAKNDPVLGKIINKKGALEKTYLNSPELFVLGLYQLVVLALDKKNLANESAGKLFAFVDALIAENREKVCEVNEAYRRERQLLGKLLRKDVWFPKSPLYRALHREVWHCWFYRGELPSPLGQPQWPLEEYQPLMNLRPLSLNSLSQWEKELWKLVKRHNPLLRAELQKRYKRVETRWSKYRKEFHQHLHTIVAAINQGTLAS